MKFTSILVSSLIVGSTMASLPATPANFGALISETFNFLVGNIGTYEMWSGFVLGIQQDKTNTMNQCYLSFQSMVTQQLAINAYLADTTTNTAGNSILGSVSDNKYYQPGTYIVLSKRYVEMSTLFFTLYK